MTVILGHDCPNYLGWKFYLGECAALVSPAYMRQLLLLLTRRERIPTNSIPPGLVKKLGF